LLSHADESGDIMNRNPAACATDSPLRGGTSVGQIRRHASDQKGAVTLMFALSASLMIGALSMSIDLIRYEISQARLQAALDAANLSSAVDMGHYGTSGCPSAAGLATWQADALAYYNVNMPADYLNLWNANSNFSANCTSSSTGGQLIQLSASGTLPLMTPAFLTSNSKATSSSSANSGSTMQVVASNGVLRTPQTKLELALVLDNTGSMADPPNDLGSQASSYNLSKIYGLKAAATSLLASLFAQNSSTYYIGIVPFASTVNVKGALNSTGTWLNRVNNINPGGVSPTTPDNAFNGYVSGSTTGPIAALSSSSQSLLGQWSWTTNSNDVLSGSYQSGPSSSRTQSGSFVSGSSTTTSYPTATWSWAPSGAPQALPTGSWWSWSNGGWGGCVVEPRDSNGNLSPQAYTAAGLNAAGLPAQFTPYYYNSWPTGTWSANTTGYVSANSTGSQPVTSNSTTGPGMNTWTGSATGTMTMTATTTTTITQSGSTKAGTATTTTATSTSVSWKWKASQTLSVTSSAAQANEAALSTWPQTSISNPLFSGSYSLAPTSTTASGLNGTVGTTTSTSTWTSSSSSFQWTWTPASASAQASTNINNANQNTQNYMCIGTPVMFLTNNQAALDGEINAMQPSGDTVIPLGLMWGWRMLSSTWSDYTAGSGNGWNQSSYTDLPSLPMPETTVGLQRVLILMTDGVNSIGSPTTTFNGLSGVGTDSLGTTATGTYSTTSGTNGVSNIDAFQQQVCTAIKNQGITIYTIAFGTGAQANTELQACASPGDFFYASSNTALNTVFQQIATNIGMLQLVQ
jgi:Flp pilus assembly protein TadG